MPTTILVCDGGCGAQSPDPATRLHEASNWFRVRAEINARFERVSAHNDLLFCRKCSPSVVAALEPNHG